MSLLRWSLYKAITMLAIATVQFLLFAQYQHTKTLDRKEIQNTRRKFSTELEIRQTKNKENFRAFKGN